MKHLSNPLILIFVFALLVYNNAFGQLLVENMPVSCSNDSVTLFAVNNGGNATLCSYSADNKYSSVVPIGFTFTFYGTNYNNLIVGSNGNLSFNISNASSFDGNGTFSALLGNNTYKNNICGAASMLTKTGGVNAKYFTTGNAPNRKFVVSFCQDQFYACTTETLTMQVVICETSNNIEIHIAHKDVGCRSAIQGVENPSGTDAVVTPGRNSGEMWSAQHDAHRYSPITFAGINTYSVTSIPFKPEMSASATITWYDSTSGAYLGSGDTLRVPLTFPYKYVAMGVDCLDTLPIKVNVNFGGVVIDRITSHNTTNCTSGCNGSLVIHANHLPGSFDTIYYKLNSAPQSQVTALVQADSTVVLTGLCPGIYSDLYLKVTGASCPSNISGPDTISAQGPSLSPISGPSEICTGTAVTLYDTVAGKKWVSTNSAIATISSDGVVFGVSPGLDTISYVDSSICGVYTVSKTLLVNTTPSLVNIYGRNSICSNDTFVVSTLDSGGVWGLSDWGLASITTDGVVMGLSAGSDTVFYTLSNDCGPAISKLPFNVLLRPSHGVISGPSQLCVGNTIILSDNSPGGSWEVGNHGSFFIQSTGFLTGLNAGSGVATYNIRNQCGSVNDTMTVTVLEHVSSGYIEGPDTIKIGAVALFTDGITGGVWSSMHNLVIISATGEAWGFKPGIDSIIYSNADLCGSDSVYRPVVIADTVQAVTFAHIAVNPSPNKGKFTLFIQSDIKEDVWVELNTSDGRLVKSIIVPTQTNLDIDLVAPAGLYFITSKSNSRYGSTKFVIVH